MSYPKIWADRPFKLLETPQYKLKKNIVSDEYVNAATIMVHIHNILIRGINSIYLQAPHVKPEDYEDFIAYCKCWSTCLEVHHHGEELRFFPAIEKMTGKKGIMDVNVEQHQAFEPGLKAYTSYLTSLTGREHLFSGTELTHIIDEFGSTLATHLADEIPTLLSLSKFGSKLPILKLTNEESKRAAAEQNKTEGSMFFFLNLDTTFEKGIHSWPPIPWMVRWVIVRAFSSWNAGWWRFSSCDVNGRPKALFASSKL